MAGSAGKGHQGLGVLGTWEELGQLAMDGEGVARWQRGGSQLSWEEDGTWGGYGLEVLPMPGNV